MRKVFALSAIAALALGGCATVPSQLAGTDFAAITPKQAASQDMRGSHVRWGGEIIKVEPKSDSTCFEILARTLYSDARPRHEDNSDGRFIACSSGFFDPELYTKGRDLTVTGHVTGTEQHKVGDFDYTYARVDADNVYLWPIRQAQTDYYQRWPYYSDPFWGPYGGWWGGYGAPPIVIVHGSAPPPPPPPKH